MRPFDELLVWRDPVARTGPECMAVDELILRGLGDLPVLRIYEWKGDWASMGYFGNVKSVQESFGSTVSIVRRWTGGGVVDHRDDMTYSLMIPHDHRVARERGAGSYRVIHQAVAEAMGCEASLVPRDSDENSDQCFERPVAWDVVNAVGRKLAGAGQRRTRWGLLHQGSVQPSGERELFYDQLERSLAGAVKKWEPLPPLFEEAGVLAKKKYGC